MTIDIRKEGEVCILDLAGRLTFPDATALLRLKSRELIAERECFFLLNMLQVPWLDSSGIGEVIACYKRAREQDGTVKLIVDAETFSQFAYCHLEKMFEIFPTEAEALASFAPEAG